jgi:hypothetical protein
MWGMQFLINAIYSGLAVSVKSDLRVPETTVKPPEKPVFVAPEVASRGEKK